MVRGEKIPWGRFQNNIHTILPPSKYGKSNPEYYPLDEQGARWIPPNDRYRTWFPCTSNPEVVRRTVEYINQWFTDHPEESTFSLGQDDARWCCCDDCRVLDADPTDYDRRRAEPGVFSNRYYRFVNEVAAQVRKTHPHRYLGVLIYNVARLPPTNIDKLEDNVFGYLTQHSFEWYRPGVQAEDEALSRQWAAMCENLSRYTYYGLNTLTPRYAPRIVDREIKLDGELGFQGMYIEFSDFHPNTVPMIWASAKLQWDRSLKLDDLLDEYMRKMYGDVAPIMARHWDVLETAWMTDHPGRRGTLRDFAGQVAAMRPADLDQAMALLDEALAATADPSVRQRILIHQAGLRYGGYGIWLDDLTRRIVATSVTDRASADRVLALAERQAALLTEAEAFWGEAPDRDDLVGLTLRTKAEAREKWPSQFAAFARAMALTAAGDKVADALHWYAHHAPDQHAIRTETLSAAHARYAQVIQAVQWARTHQPANLFRNSGFERTLDASPDRGWDGWTPLGAPANYTSWARYKNGQWGVVTSQGIDGSQAALLQSEDTRNMLRFRQALPVKPHERYLVIVQARSALGRETHADVEIYLDAGAGYVIDQNVGLPVGKDWQPLTLLVDTPENASTLLIVLNARGAAGVYYDDIQVHRVDK